MKKFFVLFVILLCTSLFLISFNNSPKIVVIDAGHGGVDHGVTYRDGVEKEIVQNIANKIKEFLH